MKGKRIVTLLLGLLILIPPVPQKKVFAAGNCGELMLSPIIGDNFPKPGEVIYHNKNSNDPLVVSSKTEGLPDGCKRVTQVQNMVLDEPLKVGQISDSSVESIKSYKQSNSIYADHRHHWNEDGKDLIDFYGDRNLDSSKSTVKKVTPDGNGKYITEFETVTKVCPSDFDGVVDPLDNYILEAFYYLSNGKMLNFIRADEKNLAINMVLREHDPSFFDKFKLSSEKLEIIVAMHSNSTAFYDYVLSRANEILYSEINNRDVKDRPLLRAYTKFTVDCDEKKTYLEKKKPDPIEPGTVPTTSCSDGDINCGEGIIGKYTVDTYKTYFMTDLPPEPPEINHRPCDHKDNTGWNFWNEGPFTNKMISSLDKEKQDMGNESKDSRQFNKYANGLTDKQGQELAYSTAKEITKLDLNQQGVARGEYKAPEGNVGINQSHIFDSKHGGEFIYSGLPFTPASKEVWKYSTKASWCPNDAMTNIYDGWYSREATPSQLARLDRAGTDTKIVENYVSNISRRRDPDESWIISQRFYGLTAGQDYYDAWGNKYTNAVDQRPLAGYKGDASTNIGSGQGKDYTGCTVYDSAGNKVLDLSRCDIPGIGSGRLVGLSTSGGGSCKPSIRDRWNNGRVFVKHSPGFFNIKWMDMTLGRNDDGTPRYSEASNIARRCQVAYDGIIVPPQQIWMVQHFDIYENRYRIIGGDCPCIQLKYICDYDSEGYPYNCRWICARYQNPTCPKGTCPVAVCNYSIKTGEGAKPPVKDSVLPPVYMPRRMWNYRKALATEYHGFTNSYINRNPIDPMNPNDKPLPEDNPSTGPKKPGNSITSYISSKRIEFKDPMEGQIGGNEGTTEGVVKKTKSGYGVTYFGRTRFFSDWGRPEDNGGIIVADNNGIRTPGSPDAGNKVQKGQTIRSYLIRPNRTINLDVSKGANNEMDAEYYNPNIVYSDSIQGPSDSPHGSKLVSSAPNKKYVMEPLQAMPQVPTTDGSPPKGDSSNQNFAIEPGNPNEPGSKYKWRSKSGIGIIYGTKIGYFHAHPAAKGFPYDPGKGEYGLVPSLKPSREHFIHLDYPDGDYTIGSMVDIQLVRRDSSNNFVKTVMDTRYGNFGNIEVKGNMFEDSFVSPTQTKDANKNVNKSY